MLRNNTETYDLPLLTEKQNRVIYKITPALFPLLFLGAGVCLCVEDNGKDIVAMASYIKNVMMLALPYV